MLGTDGLRFLFLMLYLKDMRVRDDPAAVDQSGQFSGCQLHVLLSLEMEVRLHFENRDETHIDFDSDVPTVTANLKTL